MAGKKTGKRLLTWVLVLVMALSLLPLNALAAEADEAAALQMSDEDNSGDRSLMPAKTTYTITFDAKGGKLSNGNETFKATYNSRKALVKSGDVANSNILDENPSNPPNVFQGWYYKDLLGIEHKVNVEKDKVSDVLPLGVYSRIIYAKWKLPDGFKEASIFYLKDPTKNRDSNTGEDWNGPLGGKEAGFVDTTGLVFTKSDTPGSGLKKVENSWDVQPNDVTWPTGFGKPNANGLELDKDSTVWNDIFEAFKEKVEKDNGVGSLTADQVDSITLVPYKVSRGNQTDGSYHVDCDVVIKCNFVTVDFMVKNDSNVFASILPNGKMTCPKGQAFQGNIPTAPKKDGYEFDCWYTDETYATKADFTTALTTDTVFYGKYTEKETPAPEPADPELGVNFNFDKNIVDVICETTSNHNASYRLMNGYYTVSDKQQLSSGNWKCTITIDLAKYFELYNSDSQHPGHTRDMEHEKATAIKTIYPTWSAKSRQWSCAESLIDAAEIYVKCDATPTEYIPVTLTANSDTLVYNGMEQTLEGYTGAPEGVTFEGITATGSGANAGEYTVRFSDGAVGKTDTTGKYIVAKTVDGKLTINPLDVTVTIKGNTGTYEYDGTEKTVEGYTAKIDNNLYTEADFQLVGSQAKISASVPGTYQMGLKPENFKNTNPNFNVTFVVNPGKLTIENRPITITANDVTVKYDGRPHGENGYSITKGSLVNGHAATVTISGSETDAGEYEDLLVPSVTKIVDAKGNDVTSYYDISYEDGFLTINKRSVTLTSETASKVYDGTALTKPNVKVTGDGFVEGEVTDIRATGSVTHVSEGEVTNTITFTKGQKFKDSNYDITKNEGTLKITEASAPTPGTFDFNDVVYGDGKVTPAITKTVKGNVGRNFKETFKVTVEPKSDNAKNTMTPDYYTGKAEVIASKSLKDVPFLFKPEAMANAVVPYGKLRFTEAGTYTYTVQEEIPGGTSRMSYDTTEYTLTIKVVLNKNTNKYEVESWQFPVGNREYPTLLNIVNTYRTYHPSTPSKPTLNTGDHYAYVMGYPDGTVRPNGSITRAEVSTILFRLLSDKTRDEYFTTESSFTDVKAGAWYNNSIATLEKAGVIVDTAKGGAFRPNEAITRAELAAMLAQFSDAKPVKGVKFSDVSAEHWAYEAIAIAAKMGWIEGYPDGTFRPDATITRAEMMTLVNRALDRVPSDEDHLLSKRVMLTFPDCKSGDWFYIAVQEATNSHTYERAATEKNGDEQWTALRANRDWTLLEK